MNSRSHGKHSRADARALHALSYRIISGAILKNIRAMDNARDVDSDRAIMIYAINFGLEQ